MPRIMIPPLPDSGGSEQDSFKGFAKAILSEPKSEITPADDVLAKLHSAKQKIDAKLAEVRRELAKRNSTKPKRSGRSYRNRQWT